ncbi:MAG: cell division topological specificity factor MinE [Clostridiales bacterium]|nr:cell division topological specificity factor MinE [Roseburia sp.]MDD7638200.1 cell division topological specificity factor MinE [Clostridiales bacterium]MDY4114008.1 cell division topological specificity factor MinE [Roseburia sp.]
MCHKSGKKNVAKERLKLMIDARKKRIDDDTMNQIRQEIGSVVTKYVDIEPENIEIKIILKEYR